MPPAFWLLNNNSSVLQVNATIDRENIHEFEYIDNWSIIRATPDWYTCTPQYSMIILCKEVCTQKEEEEEGINSNADFRESNVSPLNLLVLNHSECCIQ